MIPIEISINQNKIEVVQGQTKSFNHKNELMIGFFIINLIKEYFIEFNQSYLYQHYIKIHEQHQQLQSTPSSSTSTPLFTTKKQKLNNGSMYIDTTTTITSSSPSISTTPSPIFNKSTIESLESYFDHLCQLVDNLK